MHSVVHEPGGAEAVADRQAVGGVPTAWIAATAIHLGAPLLTHNLRHFAGVKDLQAISYA
jgi:predicted nucleic acid-binding protein